MNKENSFFNRPINKLLNLMSPYREMPKEIYIIFISKIVNAIGCFVIPLLTIILTDTIGLSNEVAGKYISISGVMFMLAAIIGGKLADTIGRKKVIIIFQGLGALLYSICGFIEPSMKMVYILMFAGACMSMAEPAHDSLVADIAPPDKRKGAFALSYLGWNIGFAIGPTLGGMFYKNHLPLVFIGDAFTAFMSLILISIFIKETLHKNKNDIVDESRILEKGQKGSAISVLLKRPVLIYFSLIIILYEFTYSQWSYLIPLHVVQNFGSHIGTKYYGAMASFNGIVVIIFTPLLTKLTVKVKNIRVMVYSGIMYAVGFGMLGVLYSLPFFYISVFIFTLGEIAIAVSSTPFIINHTPVSHRGRMSAIMPMLYGSGYAVGPYIMGKILKNISIEEGWILIGGITLVAAGLMYCLERYDDRAKLKFIKVQH